MSREDPTSQPAILIVDDNHSFVDLTAEILGQEYPGAELGSAGTGEEALFQLVKRDWDVVLLDYRLPDFDGLEVLAEIRKQLLDVAVVVITGEGDESLAADLFRMGASDYLVKSQVSVKTLTRTVSQVLMRRLMARQILLRSDGLVTTGAELEERNRVLDTAYDKLRDKKEQLRLQSDSLEAAIQERTAELKSTSAFLNGVLGSTTDHFIVATDSDGIILTFNSGAEASFGLRADKVVGRRHYRSLFQEFGESDDRSAAAMRDAGPGSGAPCELRGIGEGGREFLARVSLAPLVVEGGGSEPPGGMVIVGTDVTHERKLEEENRAYTGQIEAANRDLRRKNEQILEATRLKSEFLANVSHELRTPLNAIIGYADLLLGGIYGAVEDRQVNALDGIARRANDLLELINGILDLARIEAGRLELRAEPFELKALMEELIETGRVLAVQKDLELEWRDSCEGDVDLVTDRQKLRQILFNLMDNAIKFTVQGFVRVETSLAPDGGVRIAVLDSGIGISDEASAMIFEEFRQVDGTSTREYGGSGLGLAISRKYARLLGGELVVSSASDGGSRFELLVPRVLAEEARGDSSVAAEIAEGERLEPPVEKVGVAG